MKNINLMNGNPNSWQSVDELTDEEIKQCLEAIGQINAQAYEPHMDHDESVRISMATDAADVSDSDRECVQKWTDSYGELVIG